MRSWRKVREREGVGDSAGTANDQAVGKKSVCNVCTNIIRKRLDNWDSGKSRCFDMRFSRKEAVVVWESFRNATERTYVNSLIKEISTGNVLGLAFHCIL